MRAAGLRPVVARGSKGGSRAQIPSSLPGARVSRFGCARIRRPRELPTGCPLCPDRVAMPRLPAPRDPTRRTDRVPEATRYTGQRQCSREGLWVEQSEEAALRRSQGSAAPVTLQSEARLERTIPTGTASRFVRSGQLEEECAR